MRLSDCIFYVPIYYNVPVLLPRISGNARPRVLLKIEADLPRLGL